MKSIALLALLLTLVARPELSLAQNPKGEIKGKIIEAKNKTPLPYATIAVYTAQDTALVTFRVSDEKGAFRASGLPLQVKLRLVVSMTGFAVFRRELTLTSQHPSQDIGEVSLGESANLLKEVLILAEIPPVIIRQDTLEFNASSFKTLPTALVEDLLKKMPGVSVDNAGNISVNGKPVNRILVDGKEFFGDDPKIATRNLPADVIDKVQVMNDPEALRRDPDLPANLIPQVINLKFKKGIKKGLFGKMYAGAGTQDRYEAGGIVNMFRDTTQVSVLGYTNNLNRPGFGFSDISRIGGFDRVGFQSLVIRQDGGFAINDISFGGTEEGIQQSNGGGANFNTILDKKLKLNLLYFFGNTNADLNQINHAEQFLNADTINTRRTRNQGSANYSHRIGGRLEWKPDPSTTLEVRPNISISHGTASQYLFTQTNRNVREPLNQSTNQQQVENGARNYSAQVSLSKSFKKKGRSFYFGGNYSFGDGLNEQFNDVINAFYSPQSSTSILNQLRQSDKANVLISQNINYNEPLVKNLSATMRLNSDYFNDQNGISTFQTSPDDQHYDILVPALSDFLHREGWRNSLSPGLKWSSAEKKMMITPGFKLQALQINNVFQKNPAIRQNFFYVLPTFNFTWKNFQINYNTYIREPNAADLQVVADNSNPLFVQAGNPGLKPVQDNALNLSYRKYDAKRLLSYDFSVNGTQNANYIIRERFLSPEGVQTTRPVNVDGVYDVSSWNRFSKEYKLAGNKQFSFGARLSAHYNKSLVLLNEIRSGAKHWNFTPSVEGRMNLNDKLEWSHSFGLGRQISTYASSAFDNRDVTYRNWRSEIVIRSPKKLVWEAQVDYRYNPQVAPGLQKSFMRLNAGLTYLFLKNDRAQLKLSVYDLLDQNIGFYRMIRENMVEDTQTTVLNRYALLTFTYNIRNFGGKVGGTNSLFRF